MALVVEVLMVFHDCRFDTMELNVRSAISKLNALNTTEFGLVGTAFLGQLNLGNDADVITFAGHDLTDGSGTPCDLSLLRTLKRQVLSDLHALGKSVAADLQDRFPDASLASCFRVFDPVYWKSSDRSCADELQMLSNHYGCRVRLGDNVFNPPIAVDRFKAEFSSFESTMKESWKRVMSGQTSLSVGERVMKDGGSMAQYYHAVWDQLDCLPCIRLLVSIALTLPITSVEAERVFSSCNRIKSAERNRLQEPHINACLRVATVVVSLAEFKTRVLPACMASFLGAKTRRMLGDTPEKKRKAFYEKRVSVCGKRAFYGSQYHSPGKLQKVSLSSKLTQHLKRLEEAGKGDVIDLLDDSDEECEEGEGGEEREELQNSEESESQEEPQDSDSDDDLVGVFVRVPAFAFGTHFKAKKYRGMTFSGKVVEHDHATGVVKIYFDDDKTTYTFSNAYSKWWPKWRADTVLF